MRILIANTTVTEFSEWEDARMRGCEDARLREPQRGACMGFKRLTVPVSDPRMMS